MKNVKIVNYCVYVNKYANKEFIFPMIFLQVKKNVTSNVRF